MILVSLYACMAYTGTRTHALVCVNAAKQKVMEQYFARHAVNFM